MDKCIHTALEEALTIEKRNHAANWALLQNAYKDRDERLLPRLREQAAEIARLTQAVIDAAFEPNWDYDAKIALLERDNAALLEALEYLERQPDCSESLKEHVIRAAIAQAKGEKA